MSKEEKLHIETIAVRGEYESDEQRSITLPIHTTSAYRFDSTDQAAALFDLEEDGNTYSRVTNPTWDALGDKVSALEGGIGGLAASTGSAAITLAILNICGVGDHIITSQNLYGGTYSLFAHTFKDFGIEVSFVNQDLPLEALETYIKPNTKAVFAETIGNPKNDILDFNKFSELAKKAKSPLIIDNTFPTPYLFKPFDHGAHIIVHSATKYLGGHGNALGGVIVDSGKFDWNNGRFPKLTTPDPSYHGVVYTDLYGNEAYIKKARVQLIRSLGSTIGSFNAFLIHTGIETLHLRVARQSENALVLAKWLEAHPKVEWVSYPLLESHKDYDLAKKYFPKGASGMVAFGVKGDYEATRKVIDSTQLAIHAVNLGDVRTLISHPASTTHRQLSEAEQLEASITPNLIRISVGIENIEDITDDLAQAFNHI